MTLFELVKMTLDSLYEEATGSYESEVDNIISERISYLAESYTKLAASDRTPVDYKDPATRFAYVYMYVASHGDYIVQILEKLRNKLGGKIFSNTSLRVACVGGGPGSDVIALLKYLEENSDTEEVSKIIFYLLDKEQAWADTWTEIDDGFDSDLAVNVNFQPLDVTDSESWQYQTKFLGADIFTLSYFVSEIYTLSENSEVEKFWDKLFSSAKTGALFIYDDNSSTVFTSYFEGFCEKYGLVSVVSKDSVSLVPRGLEQASELAFYKDKFGRHTKLRSQISYRVMKKA